MRGWRAILEVLDEPLYRNLDRFDSSTTPDEGEETNSILIDEGLRCIVLLAEIHSVAAS